MRKIINPTPSKKPPIVEVLLSPLSVYFKPVRKIRFSYRKILEE